MEAIEDQKRTLVLGASLNPVRYANRAILELRRQGHPVVALGLREGRVADVAVVKAIPEGVRINTVTIYLNAANQRLWEQQMLALLPGRIIFNPGAENPAFAELAKKAGISTIEACTLVLLGTGQY